MGEIASGVFKKLAIKKQTAFGVQAPAAPAASAKYLRRTSSTLDKNKATYQSAEINESQQVRDMRHGVGAVAGTINGELSVGGYQSLMESVLRAAAVQGGTSAALATIAAATTGDRTGTFTRSAGSFLTDGFKIGDVVRVSGFTAPALENNRNWMISALTATVMTVVSLSKEIQVVAKAAGDNVTITTPGKKIWTPSSGHTRDFFTVEHWHSDIGSSEVFTDVKFATMNISLPPSGMATIEFPAMGIDMVPGTAQYFTSPAASATGEILAAASGVVVVKGKPIALLTGFTLNVNGNAAYADQNGVVGSNTHAGLSAGILNVTGQATILFESTEYRDIFLAEEEVMIAAAFTAGSQPNADFEAFVMSRVKFGGAGKDDAQTGLTQTLPFTALENVKTGGAALPNLQTTLSIQDSLFV